MESQLRLKDICVKAENKVILSVDEFALAKGQVLGLVGENGAGKSTLLRCLSLIEKKSKAIAFYEGEPVSNVQLIRKKIGLVFQDSLLFKGNVEANVAYPLKLRKLPKKEIAQKVENILNAFGLEDLALRSTGFLSGGEAKRVCLARALVYDPSILLLDEPFRELDQKIRKEVESLLFSYVKANNITTVLVSHNFDEIIRYCDELAIIHQGKIIKRGLTEVVISTSAEKEVASVLGDSSFIKVRIEEVNGQSALVKAGDSSFMVACYDDFKVGQKAFVSLRPEDIFISNNGSFKNSSVRNSFTAKITAIEKRDSFSRLKLQTDFLAEASITKQSVEELDLHEGKEVVAGFKATPAKLIKGNDD